MGASVCKGPSEAKDVAGHEHATSQSDAPITKSERHTDAKGVGKGKTPVTWDYIKEHMNEDHADSLLAYAMIYCDMHNAEKAVLNDVSTEGFMMTVTCKDGESSDVNVPFESPVADVAGVGPVMQSMSKKARNKVFIEYSDGVSQHVTFQVFNDLNKAFNDACKAGKFSELHAFYMDDAVLVPLSPDGPAPTIPIVAGHKAIKSYFASLEENAMQNIGLKSMRLFQSSNTEVTELGRAWGPHGKSYVRQWVLHETRSWLLQRDTLPLGR